jgi:hypothetical protein
MTKADERDPDAARTVRVRGVERPYLERRRIRRRTYYLLERIGSPLRKRFLAFDPFQGPGGDFFLVQHRCYAAPELQTGSVCDGFAADQFSVSVVFYELLTGVLPYDGLGGKAGRPEYVTQAADTPAPPSRVAQACRDLPRSLRDRLDAVVLRGLALNPERRFPDRHVWLNELYESSARFRLTPELPALENLLTRVIRRLIGVRDKP